MKIVTAGAYIGLQDRYLFVFGPNPDGDRLAVVRVGGHAEANEMPWECAVREAQEETGLTIRAVPAARTFRVHKESLAMEPIPWHRGAPQPLLVIPRGDSPDAPCNVMYMAVASGIPAPSSEVRGLLLLTEAEVVTLCRRPTTLRELLAAGDIALMRTEYDPDLLLHPALQCQLLARLLETGT